MPSSFEEFWRIKAWDELFLKPYRFLGDPSTPRRVPNDPTQLLQSPSPGRRRRAMHHPMTPDTTRVVGIALEQILGEETFIRHMRCNKSLIRERLLLRN